MGIKMENGGIKKRRGYKSFLQNLVSLIYRRIFHEEISADVNAFLKNLLIIGIGTAISTLCSTIFTILGGRLLGPEEYGKFVLIQSVAMFLYVPMLLGFSTAMLRYTSEKDDYKRQSNIIITTLILVLLLTVASIMVYLIFASPLSRLFGISTDLFYLAITFAGLFVFYILTTSALRGLNRMRAYSVFQIIYGSIILLSFLAFILNRQLSFKIMIYPTLLAYSIIIILIFVLFMRKLARWKFDISLARMLGKYSIFTAIGSLSFTFYSNIDRIMIGRYMTVTDVGIYGAYYAASISVAGLFWGMFNLVYFPTISSYKNKSPIFHKINKFIPYLVCLGIPCVLICEYIVLKLYGNQYSIDIFWMIYFAIASICIVIEGVYSWLLSAIGLRGAKISSFTAIVIAVVNVGLNFILIPKYGIAGAIICLIISYIVSIMMKLWIGRDYLRNGTDK